MRSRARIASVPPDVSPRSSLNRHYFALSFALAAGGCAAGPTHVFLPGPDGPTAVSVTDLTNEYPIPNHQNIHPTLLGQTEALSYHVIQIRGGETPHTHAEHDVVVTLLSGQGTLHVEGHAMPLKAGDTAMVRRGQVHFFINTGDVPAAAFATFAPPYDGRDNVPAD